MRSWLQAILWACLKRGDRVVGTFFPHWFGGARDAAAGRGTYGTQADGWLTSYKVVDEESLVSVPDYLSWGTGCHSPLRSSYSMEQPSTVAVCITGRDCAYPRAQVESHCLRCSSPKIMGGTRYCVNVK
uniref:Alcohol dehydrogenase n=1 Tax=Klebsiella pneumoniae TaxID=573 RepID=A0A8B0SY97_KLEPN|nr:Alcohol dehydrogenase [Klebsiella pneumoniae]